MAGNAFEGWYLKHQKGDVTVAFIPGQANDTAFIQIITNKDTYNAKYPLSAYKMREALSVGDCVFSKTGIKIDINTPIRVFGEIAYSQITPIQYDIMGVFKYFPMECRHGVISMRHTLSGSLCIDGKTVDFDGGVGYIEQDSGTSFPESYLWLQCNDFDDNSSIMVSIAKIPFLGFRFMGCICIVYYQGIEYRLATYLGVKIKRFNEKKIILEQGKYRLEIDVEKKGAKALHAPAQGRMTRTIHECASCRARFQFTKKGSVVFDAQSDHASYEFVW